MIQQIGIKSQAKIRTNDHICVEKSEVGVNTGVISKKPLLTKYTTKKSTIVILRKIDSSRMSSDE